MSHHSHEVHGILSFAVGLADEQERSRLRQYLEGLIRQGARCSVQEDPLGAGLLVLGDDELPLLEIREHLQRAHHGIIGELNICYKETIRKAADAEGKYIRHTGGLGNYGHVKIRIEPNEAGKGFEFIDDIKGGVVPREYVKPVEQGIREALRGGVLAGYEIIDLKAILFDGSYHDLDSNEMAFSIAGSMALKQAARNANPIVLEPVTAVEATGSRELIGTILRDLSARRGSVASVEHAEGTQVVRAMVPLAEMLSSSAHGRPAYPMHFAGYRAAPRRDGYFDDEAPVYIHKPQSPGPRAGSAAAEPED